MKIFRLEGTTERNKKSKNIVKNYQIVHAHNQVVIVKTIMIFVIVQPFVTGTTGESEDPIYLTVGISSASHVLTA